MENRFFVAIALCIGIYLLFLPWLEPPKEPAEDPNGVPKAGAPADPGEGGVEVSKTPVEPSSDTASDGSIQSASNWPIFPEESLRLENELLTVDLSSVGAVATEVRLVEYQEDDYETPLLVVGEEIGSGPVFGLTKFFDLESRSWRVVEKSATSATFMAPVTGGDVVKRVSLSKERPYQIDVEIDFPSGLGETTDYRMHVTRTVHYDGHGGGRDPENERVIGRGELESVSVEHTTVSNFEAQDVTTVRWAGLASNFFAFVGTPIADAAVELRTLPEPEGEPGDRREKLRQQGVPVRLEYERAVEPGGTHRYEFFAGPKARDVLAKHEATGLPDLVSYGGPLAPLVRLFLWMFSTFESFTGSYGIAIIFLTFLVKLSLHPMNKRNQGMMQRQQKKMGKLQPEMERVKKQYKNDKMRQQQELQALFKKHEVNPLAMAGGCLLMFLQLPIWIGLIQTFKVAIELRHESFLFIRDLMQPDQMFTLPFDLPLFGSFFNVLPLLYVVLTLINQKLMPKPTNEQMAQQQKIMTFMLVGFGVFFYQFPSGLLLYFMTSAGLGIIEQRIIRAELAREGLGDTPTPSTSAA